MINFDELNKEIEEQIIIWGNIMNRDKKINSILEIPDDVELINFCSTQIKRLQTLKSKFI